MPNSFLIQPIEKFVAEVVARLLADERFFVKESISYSSYMKMFKNSPCEVCDYEGIAKIVTIFDSSGTSDNFGVCSDVCCNMLILKNI